MKKKLYFLTAICLLASLSIGCKDNNEEPDIPTNLAVDKTSFSVDASESKQSLSVFSNKEWTVHTESGWLTLSPVSGSADSWQNVEITVSANPETEERDAIITVSSDDKTIQVALLQSGKIVIPPIPGIEIADEKFKLFLVENFDSNGDGDISSEEAEAVTLMDCSSREIESLAGLEYFVNLDTLICSNNQLTALDLSHNSALKFIDCSGNQLTGLDASNNAKLMELNCMNNTLSTLDISKCTALTIINCSNNQLTALDISNLAALATLDCSSNQLTALDISNLAALTTLNCSNNQLTVLDVSKNALLQKLDCRNNESLSKIKLAEGQIIPELLYDPDTTQLDYPQPEKDDVDIPDAIFKSYLLENFDMDKDGEISKEEALEIKEIICLQLDIASVKGIESFPNLEILNCMNNKITSLDVSNNLKLKELSFSDNNIGTIDVSNNTLLTKLFYINCGLSDLDVKANTELLELNCSDNMLTDLDLSNNLKLERLFCQRNNIKTLDLRQNKAINTLNCRDNPSLTTVYLEQGQQIPNLYITTPPTTVYYMAYITFSDKAFFAYLLENFDTDGDGRLSNLEISEVKEIDCSNLGIASLEGINQFTNLTSLICSGNLLTTLSINSLTALVTLICDNNQLERLDISRNTKLVTVDCSFNNLYSLGTNSNTELKTLVCNNNTLATLTLSQNTKLETLLCQDNELWRDLNVSYNLSLKTLNCQNNAYLIRITIRVGQTIENLLKDEHTNIFEAGENELGIAIPDSKFREYLLNAFDVNKDGEISRAEALLVKSIDCRDLGISTLAGIEYFANLTTLRCAGNQLTYLPVSNLAVLELLDCSENDLTSLDINNLERLKQLFCRANELTVLYVMRNAELTYIDCRDNLLQSINVRQNPVLQTLLCSGNTAGFTVYITSGQSSISISPGVNIESTVTTGVTISDAIFESYLFANFDKDGNGILDAAEQAAITSIDCSKMNISSLGGIKAFTNLSVLICGYNNLSSLDLSNMTNLTAVYCHDNKLTAINVTGCASLQWLYCPGNLLTTLDVSGNAGLTMLDCSENPSLATVYLSLTNHNAGMVTKDDHTNLVFQ